MSEAAAGLLVLGFMLLIHRLRVAARARAALGLVEGAVAAMRDRSLDEHEKELAVQIAARRLLKRSFELLLLLAVAAAIPFGVVAAIASAGLFEMETVIETTVSWPILVGATLVLVAWSVRSRKCG